MKFTMKKFHLVSKYANYLTWDEKQNAPSLVYWVCNGWNGHVIPFTKKIQRTLQRMFKEPIFAEFPFH